MANTFKVKKLLATSGIFSSLVEAPNLVYNTGDQTVGGIKTFSNKVVANSGIDIYFSGTAGTGVFVSGLWNNTGQTYVGIRYDVSLASGVVPSTTNSLANIRVNNTGVFNINSKGQVLIQQLGGITYTNTFEVKRGNSTYFKIRDDGATEFGLGGNQACWFGGSISSAIKNGGIVTANGGFLGFSKTADPANNLAEHTVRLYRGGDFVLDLRNATYPVSGHQFRVFNITGTNTGEFGLFGWQRTGTAGTPNALVVGAQATQNGTLRDLIITGANININASGTTNFNNRPTVNGTGVLLSGEAAQLPNTIVYTTGNQSINGLKIFNEDTDFKQDINVSGFYNFDTTNTGEALEGQMGWYPDYNTIQIGMDAGNVINPVGFKSFYRVKAASTIRKGTVVMAAGAVGNSEFILAREAQNIGSSGELIMGVSAEQITAGNFGDVVAFGPVKGVDTSILSSGNILYYDPLSTGGFTDVPPQAPNAKVIVALALTQSSNGTVFVRVNAGSELGRTDSNVLFNNLQNNDIIRYSSSGYWYNTGVDFNLFATTGNLFLTGANLNSKIDTLSGYSNNTFATITNLAATGAANLSRINNLSGYINSSNSNIVFTTGDQTVSGFKDFRDGFYLNNENNVSSLGTKVFGNVSGITLITFQNATDITIASDYVGGEIKDIISTHNSTYTDSIFGSSINTAVFGDQIVIYQTGSTYGVPYSKGPYLRLGEHNVISEKNESRLGIGTLFPQEKVHISGGDLRVEGNATVTNHFSAASKSFLIPHPTDSSKKLQYGSLESPYHGVRLTDRATIIKNSVIVELPSYISALVSDKKTNIQLTNINHSKVLFVKKVDVSKNYFEVGLKRSKNDKKEYEFYWSFTAERKDIPKLEVEF